MIPTVMIGLRRVVMGCRDMYRHWQSGCYIVSFPKTGRTWLRVLLGKALCEQHGLGERLMLDTYRLTAAAGVPRTRFSHDDYAIREGIDYRALSWDKRWYRRKRVIFLVRDPKDVLVSCYFQATRRLRVFEGSMSEFIRSDRYGARKVIASYNIWYANRTTPRAFLMVRYEQLQAQPHATLAGALAFMGVTEMDPRFLDVAVEYGCFGHMKEMERAGALASRMMAPGDSADEESFKVRRGVVGGYRDYLSRADIDYVNGVVQEMGCAFLNECFDLETDRR